MAILRCASALQLHSDRRHRACAISQRQHRERKERQAALKRVIVSSLSASNTTAAVSSGGSAFTSTSSTTTTVAIAAAHLHPMTAKQERRALLKAELEDELVEALELMECEDEDESEDGDDSTTSDISNPSSPCYQPVTMKRERKRAFADYVFLSSGMSKQVEVIADEDDEGGYGHGDEHETGWEIVGDGDGDGDGNEQLVMTSKTYAEVAGGSN